MGVQWSGEASQGRWEPRREDFCFFFFFTCNRNWASLVVQWLRICLPVYGTWVQSLVQEDPMCCGAAGPVL